MVQNLIEAGVDINMAGKWGMSALNFAVYEEQMPVVQLLLKADADVDLADRQGRTPLMWSVIKGNQPICAQLLRNRSKINQQDRNGWTALMYAVAEGHESICGYLIRRGANLSKRNIQNQDVADIAILYERQGIQRILDEHKKLPTRQQEFVSRRTPWTVYCRLTTLLVPDFLLSVLGWREQEERDAWREKIGICFGILSLSAAFVFVTFGLSLLICQPIEPITLERVQTEFAADSPANEKFVIIRGSLYNVGVFTRTNSHPPGGAKAQPAVIRWIGKDASGLFPVIASSCPSKPARVGCAGKECHIGDKIWAALEELRDGRKVAYPWSVITSGTPRYMVIGELVYDIGTYLSDGDLFLGPEYTDILRDNMGRDATRIFLRIQPPRSIMDCMDENLLVGQVEGQTAGCFSSRVMLTALIAVLTFMLFVKFGGALIYTILVSRLMARESKLYYVPNAYVLCMVPCYSEGAEAMRKTLDSIVYTDYPDSQKLICIVADGIVTGAGNKKSTPDLVLDMIELDPRRAQGEVFEYNSESHETYELNKAKVYTGIMKTDSLRRVPVVLIVKVGLENEVNRYPGNRGKRDSQLIVMNLFLKTLLNERMSPLEFGLFDSIQHLTGVFPDRFDHVMMIDADTELEPKSLTVLVKFMEIYPNVIAACGETQLGNKFESWVTMIQVFEYYIAHTFGKSFESLFKKVTCLPGCFSIYRIRGVDQEGNVTPFLVSPDIVQSYSTANTPTLHEKNLTLLGEDRYLTSLLLRTFPKRDLMSVPDAICWTTVPAKLSVLMSQRRRWINSTIHNLVELIFVPNLCGVFCFSMQFLVLMDLIGTLLAPCSLFALFYIVFQISAATNMSQYTMLAVIF